MKLLTTILILLIFLWNINIQSPDNEENKIIQRTNTIIANVWNKDFSGLWVNEDNQTRGITKCKISYRNNSFVVQMWGACEPQDCDWGENTSNETKEATNKFEVIWDQKFAASHVTYQIIDGKLKVTDKRHYKDNSGRPEVTNVEYFRKE